MVSKVTEKTNDLIVHILNAFKHAKLNDDSALNYVRKGCEAMCKIIIMQGKGENNGIKIINGTMNNKNFSVVNGNTNSLDLFNLIDTCKFHKWFSGKTKSNENLYHKFEDLRTHTNKGSHDAMGENAKPSEQDIQYCIVIFKKIITWFWKEKLSLTLPQDIIDGINNLQINEEVLIENSNWNYLADLCDNFSSTTQNFLISPSSFEDLSKEQIAILSKIRWNMIFDFNCDSKKNGLFNAFEENVSRNFRPITIEQINQKNIVSSSKHTTNWFFAAGISDISSSIVNNYKEWRSKKYISLLEQIVEEYINQSSQSKLNVIVLYEEINYIEKLIEVISDKYPESLLDIIILSNNEDKLYQITEKFDNVKILNLSILDFIQSVNSSIQSKDLEINSIQIPAKKEDKDVFIDIANSGYIDHPIPF